MGDRLKADIGRIQQAAWDLAEVKRRFENASTVVDTYASDLGSREVQHALEDFVSNWRRHRESLTESVDKLGQIAEAAAEAYNGVDSELTKALTEKRDEVEKS